MTEYEKIGTCNGCGLCCLVAHKARVIKMSHEADSRHLDDLRDGWRVARTTKTHIYLAKWDPCHYLGFDLKCSLHNKPEQPGICRVWPDNPRGFYQVFKDKCSITFKKVKKEKGDKADAE